MRYIQLPVEFYNKYPDDDKIIIYLKYIRNKKRKPIGVIIMDDEYSIGWSLCNKKDKWDRVYGIKKAYYRLGAKRNASDINYRLSLVDKNSIKGSHKYLLLAEMRKLVDSIVVTKEAVSEV